MRDQGNQSLVVVLSSSVVQLSCNDLEDRLFEDYREIALLLIQFCYLSTFSLISFTVIQEVGGSTLFHVIFIYNFPFVMVKVTHDSCPLLFELVEELKIDTLIVLC